MYCNRGTQKSIGRLRKFFAFPSKVRLCFGFVDSAKPGLLFYWRQILQNLITKQSRTRCHTASVGRVGLGRWRWKEGNSPILFSPFACPPSRCAGRSGDRILKWHADLKIVLARSPIGKEKKKRSTKSRMFSLYVFLLTVCVCVRMWKRQSLISVFFLNHVA